MTNSKQAIPIMLLKYPLESPMSEVDLTSLYITFDPTGKEKNKKSLALNEKKGILW